MVSGQFMKSTNLTHFARYYNVTHCNGLALYGRLVRLVRNNSVWRSAVDARVTLEVPGSIPARVTFSLFVNTFLSSLIIHEVYI